MTDDPVVFNIEGMHCAGCVGIVEKAITSVPGVQDARVNLATEQAYVDTESDSVDIDAIITAVDKAGYALKPTSLESEQRREEMLAADQRKMDEASSRMRWSWGLSIPIIVWMIPEMFFGISWPSRPIFDLGMVLLAIPVLFWSGWPTYRSAWKSARNLSPNMDVLIAMGSGASLLTGVLATLGHWLSVPMIMNYAGVGAMIMAFHLTGRYVETKSRGRASQAIKKLLTLEARTARILDGSEEKEVSVDEVKVGDIMVIRPGEKIPTDGEVVEGTTFIDESLATGESIPVSKEPGDSVIGATINGNGVLKVRATGVGEDTFLSQVIKLVEQAQASEVPIQNFADRVTAVFVPIVIAIAIATFSIWLLLPDLMGGIALWAGQFLPWIDPSHSSTSLALFAAIAVLVIACPCALGLATPTALMVGSGMGAENGVLIRRGEAIQVMKDVQTILLDKTGTITLGRPVVTDVKPIAENVSESELIRLAASAERYSEHPVGGAIVASAVERDISMADASEVEAVVGHGITAKVEGARVAVGTRSLMETEGIDLEQFEPLWNDLEKEGKTVVAVASGGVPSGLIAVADPVKPDSASAISELKMLGLNPIMITGDNETTANAIAKQVGIENVIARVLPDRKSDEVIRLQEMGQIVAMVGDGINDAPALAQANVGIAIGTGTDIAIESADITLIQGELSAVIKAVKLSRATFKKIKQNLFWAYFYNAVAIPFAILGMLHPLIAEGAMAFSSINVVTNSARLRRVDIRAGGAATVKKEDS